MLSAECTFLGYILNKTDLLIIGGGINGAGIAADAALRGLSVVLCEKDDLASHTSSYSSKLIHGGLRYLEYYEFRLVRKALKERQLLLNISPNLIHPLKFIMPHNKYCRPFWLLRLGLFLYDHLNWHQSLPKSVRVNLSKKGIINPLKPTVKKALAYFDATVDDARLVVMNAQQAKKHGATILTRHEVINLQRTDSMWNVRVKNKQKGTKIVYQAKAVVNAAGPWGDDILKNVAHFSSAHHVKLVKGSHIVTHKLYEADHAYILQHEDKRIVFVIPFADDFSLIGTTDIEFSGNKNTPSIDEDEKSYLLNIVNTYFNKNIAEHDIVWSFSGVRSLFDSGENNPSALSRDYVLQLDAKNNACPLLSVFGGKITTYRYLAKESMDKLKPFFPNMPETQTAKIKLPGGDLNDLSLVEFVLKMQKKYAFLDQSLVKRLALAYGCDVKNVLKDCQASTDLGIYFGGSLYELEVRYLLKNEWAKTVDDILWRRTKQGLYMKESNVVQLTAFLRKLSIIAGE